MKTKKSIVKGEWIKFSKSKIHSNGGLAAKNIPKNTRIIEYVGNLITKKEAEKIADREIARHKRNSKNGAVYLFDLNKKYDIDGNVPWNPAKNINHSCNPNAEFDVKEGRVWIVAIKNIKKGEEITYDYGYDIENWQDHSCKCGSKNCVGYIIGQEDWDKFKEMGHKSEK